MSKPKEPQFKIGDRVIDRDGYRGVVVNVTWQGRARWYDVRFPSGDCIRYPKDIFRDPANTRAG